MRQTRPALATLCRIAALLPLLATVPAATLSAMEFKQIRLNDGTLALSASGPGDSEALRAALEAIPKDRFGARIVRLNSPGGSVFHAMQMADVFDEMRVMAVVAWDDVCASACAAVLFVAADARLLLGNGRLVFHSCDPGRATGENAALMCNGDIGRFAGEQGFSADWLFMGLQSAAEDETEITLTQRSVGCMGLQQPPGLDHYGGAPTPCMQLLTAGAVTRDRNWDRPPGSPPLRETLPEEVDRLAYLHQWSPPDTWHIRIERDAIALGFRRRGAFPNGPELALYCHTALPEELILHVRQLAPAPIPVPTTARLRVGDLVRHFPVRHNWREGTAVASAIRLDAEIRRHLDSSATRRIAVELLDRTSTRSVLVAAPWETGYVRQDLAWSFCGGRFSGEP